MSADDDMREVPCPRCRAKAGESCRDARGPVSVHDARREFAVEYRRYNEAGPELVDEPEPVVVAPATVRVPVRLEKTITGPPRPVEFVDAAPATAWQWDERQWGRMSR